MLEKEKKRKDNILHSKQYLDCSPFYKLLLSKVLFISAVMSPARQDHRHKVTHTSSFNRTIHDTLQEPFEITSERNIYFGFS